MGYKYAHDDPDGVVPQQYPPDELVGVDYYQPTNHGAEREIAGQAGQAARDHPQEALTVSRRDRTSWSRLLTFLPNVSFGDIGP